MTAGVISGSSIACQGQNAVVYTVPVIVNATSYEWTMPNGASGTSITNSILVNFGSEALSGEIIVKGVNNCGEGEEARLFVQVDPLPEAAASINGTAVVCAGAASIYYSTPDIPYAESYNWTLPPGFFGNSTTNSIEVYYSNQALSGNITVTGVNDCGEGEEASLFVQVNPLPEEPPIPIGPDEVDLKIVTETVYKTLQVQNATHYFWELEPFTMGEISSQGDSAVITWSGQLGIATLKVSGWNSICEYGPWSEVKSIWVDFSFGIDETGIKGVIVFPNPSDGIFTVKTEFPMESVLMKNAAGKTVLRPKLVDSYQIDVDANRFAKGIYFLEITHRYGKERVKLVLY
ncbi:MAG: T9SS type A sorting domain-containing protein [Bacteroidia bacterium]|nr:T9SS type A sorting domain-containing protein [Bacteroidia bacterium]